jgi:hypothetical protein
MPKSGGSHGSAPKKIAGRTSGYSLRFVAAIFTLLLFLCTGVAIAADGEPSSDGSPNADLSAPPAEPGGVELEGRRTATSETFELPDGHLETRIYGTPINYRDPDGTGSRSKKTCKKPRATSSPMGKTASI